VASAILAAFAALPAAAGSDAAPSDNASFEHVIQRVLAKGKRGYIDNSTSRMLGLNPPRDATNDCVSRVFNNDDDSLRHRFSVIEDSRGAVLALTEMRASRQTYYAADAADHLLAAVQGTSAKDAHALPLSAAKAGFEQEKTYWVKTLGDEN
jgi:hypothetical protein